MNPILDNLLGGLLGGIGKKIAQWLPSKEEVYRRNIEKYEKRLKELMDLPSTNSNDREFQSVIDKLHAEKENLERYLTSNR